MGGGGAAELVAWNLKVSRTDEDLRTTQVIDGEPQREKEEEEDGRGRGSEREVGRR